MTAQSQRIALAQPILCISMALAQKRYAMKRKVAGGLSGNFRGVCPILNRATVIPNTVCAYASCERRIVRFWRGRVRCAAVPMSPPNTERLFGFFNGTDREHTAGLKTKNRGLQGL